MTSALLWWIAVLALTWAVVVAVRAWHWTPDQADPSQLRTRERGARLALIPVAVLLLLATLVLSSLAGWSADLPDALPVLTTAAATGIGTVACLLTMAGRRVRSWWLLAGLLPAVGYAASLLGG